ncbi:PREDICTED: uncharacterized protein LOC105563538 isoform X1 [Vollenhovia emeryi]|uniref:uncharacterized protein LOC105563538 isoform X1 n=1 Tax=Vollenhovia emeryi TaxID=411798 RepID=UPI0005F4F5E8|nr:PREDICTED: uncharacterized protein LOC105563538 isoform X1 [Vollenhovia emeryi]
MSAIGGRRRARARGSSYARFRLRTNRNKSNDAESISGTAFVGRTCAFRVSDDQNGPSSSPWSLVAQHADEAAVIREPRAALRVTSREAEGTPRTRVVVALRRSAHGCIWRCPRTGAV